MAIVSVAWLRNLPPRRTAALLAQHLATAETAHATTLKSPKRQAEWLAGRLAAKHAVRAYRRRHFGVGPPTKDIVVTAISAGPRAGKPMLDAWVELSISHSGDFAIGVCAPGPIGLDLEQNRQLAPLLVRTLGTPDATAQTRIQAMPTPLRWACREAVLKYFGFGLRIDPREVELVEWRADGSFTWTARPGLRHKAAALLWPNRAWAGEFMGYSLALVW